MAERLAIDRGRADEALAAGSSASGLLAGAARHRRRARPASDGRDTRPRGPRPSPPSCAAPTARASRSPTRRRPRRARSAARWTSWSPRGASDEEIRDALRRSLRRVDPARARVAAATGSCRSSSSWRRGDAGRVAAAASRRRTLTSPTAHANDERDRGSARRRGARCLSRRPRDRPRCSSAALRHPPLPPGAGRARETQDDARGRAPPRGARGAARRRGGPTRRITR